MSFSINITAPNAAAAIAGVASRLAEMSQANPAHSLMEAETNVAAAAMVEALEVDPSCVVAVNIDGHAVPGENQAPRALTLTVRATLVQAPAQPNGGGGPGEEQQA